MKRSNFIIVFLTMIMMLMSFISCEPTVNNQPDLGDSDTTPDVVTPDDVDDPDDADDEDNTPISDNADPLWSSFEGADIQIWSGTFTAESDSTDGLKITVGSAGWWGGAFCDKADGSGLYFDMSKVAKITFDAKSSKIGSMWVSSSNNKAEVTGQTKIDLSTEWETKVFDCSASVSSNDFAVLDIGGGDLATTVDAGFVIYLKDITFWDSDNKEIVPTRNE